MFALPKVRSAANAGRSRNQAGYSLLEANMAVGMVGTFLAAIMIMNSNLLGILKNAKETASANQALQERVEQMRIANWVQITDANYISANLLNTATSSAVGLSSVVETLTVSPYSSTSATTTSAQVVRSSNAVTVNSVSPTLVNERVVRVDVKLVWQGSPDRRQRIRSTTLLIAKGGITK